MRGFLYVALVILFSVPAFGGKGGFLGIVASRPDLQVGNQWGQCVSGAGNIRMAVNNYIERENGFSCLLRDSLGTFDVLHSGEKIATYRYRIAALAKSGIETLYVHPDWSHAVQFFPNWNNGRQHRYLIGLHNGPTERWMGDLNHELHHLRLLDIVLPGTHDSGTYSISSSSRTTPDAEDGIAKVAKFVPLGRNVIAGWAKTQNLDIRGQLDRGIRYFDLRLAAFGEVNSLADVSACHSLEGGSLDSIVNQVRAFLAQPDNQEEIIVLDMNSWYHSSGGEQEIRRMQGKVFALVKEAFGDKIASRKSFSPSSMVLEFVGSPAQVIVSAPADANRENAEFVWTTKSGGLPTEENTVGADFYTYWPNKQNFNDLRDSLSEAFRRLKEMRDRDFIFIIQAQATPNRDTVLEGLRPHSKAPNNLYDFTGPIKQRMTEFLLSADTPVPKGSVIIDDFTIGVDLVALCLRRFFPGYSNELFESGFDAVALPGTHHHSDLGWIDVPRDTTSLASDPSEEGHWFYLHDVEVWAYSARRYWPIMFHSSDGKLPPGTQGWVYRLINENGQFLYDFESETWIELEEAPTEGLAEAVDQDLASPEP